MIPRRALLALAALPATARAQSEFPSRPVSIVSPYQAGGTSDIIARALAAGLAELWGRPVVVENRPGANGGIGVQQVVRAPADGHALLAVANSALTLNPVLYPNLPYVPLRDLAPITRTGTVANVLVVNPNLPARDIAQLVALARARPGQLPYASQGIGSNGQVIAERFSQGFGITMLHAPYRGSAPAVVDLISGQVQAMFDNLPSVLPHIREGRLRALGVTTLARSPLLPDVPTIAESGLPGFESSAWFALLGPAALPAPLLARIERDVRATLAKPEMTERLAAAGVQVTAEGSAQLRDLIGTETEIFREVTRRAGIKVD
jgi:tripartite-type tricarboxylate transporter receptor subunit TctC